MNLIYPFRTDRGQKTSKIMADIARSNWMWWDYFVVINVTSPAIDLIVDAKMRERRDRMKHINVQLCLHLINEDMDICCRIGEHTRIFSYFHSDNAVEAMWRMACNMYWETWV